MSGLPIDHKDEPGAYRDQVRAGVFARLGEHGTAVASREQLVGTWDVSFAGVPGTMFVYHLHGDGTSSVEVVGLGGEPAAGQWRLNADGTLSLFSWVPADPEFGIDAPQLDEDRRHVAVLASGRLAAWNGDGASVLLFSPRA